MKVSISQSVLFNALEKGAVAALSDVAKSDTSIASLLVQSAKITAGKNFVIESTTDVVASKYSLEADANGVTVSEEGSIIVPAKDLYDWVKSKSPESTITFKYTPLATPEIMDTMGEDVDDDLAIKRVGYIKITSKDKGRSGSTWKLGCYDSGQFSKSVDFSKGSTKQFSMNAESFAVSLKDVGFAAADKDYECTYDNVLIQGVDTDLYFCTTDTHRVAIRKVEAEMNSGEPMIIPTKLVSLLTKVSDKANKLSFSVNDELGKIYVRQKNLDIRIASGPKDKIGKFPSIQRMLTAKCKMLTEVDKGQLMSNLRTASLINDHTALFEFEEKIGRMTIKSVSDINRKEPNVSQIAVTEAGRKVSAVWGVKHLMEASKVIKGDVIKFMLPDTDNVKFVKILDNANDDFTYFAMTINNPNYA